jgi:hypothetical protein
MSNDRLNSKQSGQALIVIVSVMIIALAIGVSVSSRFVKGLRGVTQTDSSNRALAVAEAAAEKMLTIPTATLEDYIINNNCGTVCTTTITGADGVVATANVLLSYMGNSSSPFPIKISTTDITQVNLKGYANNQPVSVCWNNPASGDKPSVIGYLYYGAVGSYSLDSYAYNASTSVHSENGFSFATGANGYTNCFSTTGRTNTVMLRLKSVYNNVSAVVIPANGQTIPSQGILISSTGTVGSAVRKLSVLKTPSILPVDFDNVLYTKSTTEPLSN